MPLVDVASAGSQLSYSLCCRISSSQGWPIGALSYRVLLEKEMELSSVLRADVGLLDHLRPLGHLGLDGGVERLRGRTLARHSEIGKAPLAVRLGQQAPHLGVEVQHDVARRVCRRDQREP